MSPEVRRTDGASALGRRASPSEPGDDGVEHGLGQPAGEGVLLADVVAADQFDGSAVGPDQPRNRPVPEPGLGPRHRPARRGGGRQGGVPGDPAEGQDRAEPRAQPQPATSQGAPRRSVGVGWLPGGAQCTPATIRSPVSASPSPAATASGVLA